MQTSTFVERRKNILEQLPNNSILLLSSAPIMYRNSDCEFNYRQDSYFYYVTGFNECNAVTVLVKTKNTLKSILFCQEKDPKKEVWTGKIWGPSEAKQQFGFDESFENSKLDSKILSLLENIENIYFLTNHNVSFDKKILSWLDIFKTSCRSKEPYPQRLIDASCLLDEMRLIKDSLEIATIKKACEISVAAHIRAMKNCKAKMNECELEAEIIYEFYKKGSRSPAYTSIVAGGVNACTLHYIENNQKISPNSLVLIDAGAEYENYSSDITRTFPVNGKFSQAQKEVYEIVLSAQMAAIEKSKSGVVWAELQSVVLQHLVKGLVSLNILHGDIETLIKDKAYMPYYMHNCGHWLGLDVHDVGAYHLNGEIRKLQDGMVFTIEPGLYLPENDKNVPEQYRGIGVRIEDDILIENGKANVLTKELPKTVAQIEQIMSSQES
jgi:Xaa-Pro aminopeptidase